MIDIIFSVRVLWIWLIEEKSTVMDKAARYETLWRLGDREALSVRNFTRLLHL